MKNIQSTYATFEQAKLLKEKKWQQRTKIVWLDSLGKQHLIETNLSLELNNDEYDAPEQWQIVEWLRVEKGIWVCVNINGLDKLFTFDIHNYKQKGCSLESILDGGFITPQEAYSAAFDYILKELI